jgi:UDP-N-acetylglucosamine 4,6-dehydratase
LFNNKVILITGGTGSFGKRCTKILLENYKPKKIIIFSRDELKQWEMSQELKKYEDKLRFFIGDVRDYGRIKLGTKGVDYLIHAAALKHVPAAEYNPQECIRTNIGGAENVINVSIENKISKVISLSTDKAVSPINLYGASKLASDKLFISANNLVGEKEKTLFSIVRYGNVINSRGSVLPLFKNLIKQGKKILPLTDKRMTRFWLSLDEGVKFVLDSFKVAQGGEIFVPKIPSVKITDLAKAIDQKIQFKIIGIRPGEKIHESLCIKEESLATYELKNYYVVVPNATVAKNKNKIEKSLKKLKAKKVKENFEYTSDRNSNFLNTKQIKKLIEKR